MNAGRALVVVHVDPQPRVGGERQRQRRRAGPGRDDRVGHAGAHPLVDERGAERRGDVVIGHHSQPDGDAAWRPSRPGAGRGSCWCTASPRPAGLGAGRGGAGRATTRWSRSTLPGHGGSAERAWPTAPAARSSARSAARATYVGYSMGGRLAPALARSPDPTLVEGLVLARRHARHRGPRRAGGTGATPTRPWPRRIEADGVDAFLDEWLAPAAVRRSARPTPPTSPNAAANTAAGLAVEPAPRRHRRPGAALGSARRRSTCPCCVVAGEHDDQVRAPSASAWPTADRRQRRPSPSSRTPATPPTSSSPRRSCALAAAVARRAPRA